MSKPRCFVRAFALSALLLAVTGHPSSGQASDLRPRILANHREYIPEGDGPFPTLVAVPGCSGLAFEDAELEATHPDLGEDDRLFRAHYPRAAEQLRSAGFAVLLIHVHGAEGLVTACGGQIQTERIAAYISEGVKWAAALDFADPERIHVIGWSMGGRGVLTWLNTADSRTTPVRSVIAVYPGCQDQVRLTTHVPLLLLLGGADDIADPTVCQSLLTESTTRELIEVHVYPGARHGFDIPEAPPTLEIGDGLTMGYQQAAAEESWREIIRFLD